MSESGDYSPAAWTGHDFSDARAAYDSHVGRSYSDASRRTGTRTTSTGSRTTNAKDVSEVLEKIIRTMCTNPLLIWCDVTGSMGKWPAIIFSKLPFLEHETQVYLGSDTQISFGAIGDATVDSYPLQVRPFTDGKDLATRMLELVIEQGGGSGISETYELAALYALHNVEIPNAIKPILILIGDEKPYPSVSKDIAKSVAGVSLQATITTEEIFTRLREKFEVFLIRKPYKSSSENSMSAADCEIHQRWVELLGADRIVDLPDPNRVVDVILGILAKVVDRFDEFKQEIEGRQEPDQVKTVYKSLATIHTPMASVKGSSIMMLPGGGTKTKSLLALGDGSNK